MLEELYQFGSEISLIENSGIQFLDFGLAINDWKAEPWKALKEGHFTQAGENRPLRRLVRDPHPEHQDEWRDESNLREAVAERSPVKVEDSLKLLDGIWLPAAFFRISGGHFDAGPFNWVRMRIVAVDPAASPEGHTHRVTFAFDTQIVRQVNSAGYLGPVHDDVQGKAMFKYACGADQMDQFLELPWVDGWLREVFAENISRLHRNITADDIAEALNYEQDHQAHYLNAVGFLAESLRIPHLVLQTYDPNSGKKPIFVDLMLDIGNSRSCGVMVEEHRHDSNPWDHSYNLRLRDLIAPEREYTEPFESGVEFAQVQFGKSDFSAKSGRVGAFVWPTFARTGREARHLAAMRKGNEGATGLSSPKRYLWDTEPNLHAWKFNVAFTGRDEQEPQAVAMPLSNLMNAYGRALHILPDSDMDKEPALTPAYSRSSLMTFMLTELLLQAMMQMNSVAQRGKMPESGLPRLLRSVVLTIPPGMPKPEHALLEEHMREAIGLVWIAMGWADEHNSFDFDDPQQRQICWPILPEVKILWDEATCGQAVYLYNEVTQNYNGRPEEFITAKVRPDKADKNTITIASVDIGGGTTDLVINDYRCEAGANGGSNAFIRPIQRFRDGFKVAGDDILFDIIKYFLIDAVEAALAQAGLSEIEREKLMRRLLGTKSSSGGVQDNVKRQQLTQQVFYPAALGILKAYENYSPFADGGETQAYTLGSLLENADPPAKAVLEYFQEPVRRAIGAGFQLLEINVPVDLNALHKAFIDGRTFNISRALQPLCEVISTYQCDVLLLTGRPSQLPGIQAYFRSQMPLPVNRIIPLRGYRISGGWYPFFDGVEIEDPKTTAVVGAMICFLTSRSQLENFYLLSNDMKHYSTVRYIGFFDAQTNRIADKNVYFRDIDLDNPDYEFPDEHFEVRGTMRLAFRQLNSERWEASPLYTIAVENAELGARLGRIDEDGSPQDSRLVHVKIAIEKSKEGKKAERFIIKSAKDSVSGANLMKDVKMYLNTMPNSNNTGNNYWLESGSLKV